MRRHLKKPFTPALEQAISLMRKRQSLTPCLEQAISLMRKRESRTPCLLPGALVLQVDSSDQWQVQHMEIFMSPIRVWSFQRH